ncbi:MAG: hypothetical protein KDK96_11165 [Chlamydiia bacterium]|nr:hypothetical protein [Chlamydiia bacterium]
MGYMTEQKKRKLVLECLVGLGCFLSLGGGVLAIFKHWLGFSIMATGLLLVLIGVSTNFLDQIQKRREQRRKEPETYGFFWKSVFSGSMFLGDIVESFRKRKPIFLFAMLWHFLLVGILMIPIGKMMSSGALLWIFLGAIIAIVSLGFACLGTRGYGLVIVSNGDQRKSLRGERSFGLGIMGIMLSALLLALLSKL